MPLDEVYEVFARKSRGEPLRHIGSLNAPDDALAASYAYNTYDEERWFDMWVAPRSRFIEVFNAEVPGEGVAAGDTAGPRAPAGGATS